MAAIDDLKHLLSEDVRELDVLADLLSREKDLLGDADVRALEDVTREKNSLLEGIRERAKQKIRLLVNIGYKPDAGAPSRFIRASGEKELYQLWSTADSKLRFCQSVNENNGRILGHLQKRLSRITDIFRGASSQQKLYGAKGQQTGVSSSTVLASA
ncbi:flagella synthesis protein FlgN [Marinobacter persicus]|uniref:Flagella synthesis protein FlgN n=1 Tax=Marinobacter persicus TaxID=930118 RepID=A0A1I3WDZ7_9GAMM|nr:flagellar protein FlgN [Marinobacter persicus]GHD47428.1 hypothetical protein GCM10008110_15370 [Marinobacter persicus]SFK05735.1 flagella synthesis protein FlgN [Marinobacter persicus]